MKGATGISCHLQVKVLWWGQSFQYAPLVRVIASPLIHLLFCFRFGYSGFSEGEWSLFSLLIHLSFCFRTQYSEFCDGVWLLFSVIFSPLCLENLLIWINNSVLCPLHYLRGFSIMLWTLTSHSNLQVYPEGGSRWSTHLVKPMKAGRGRRGSLTWIWLTVMWQSQMEQNTRYEITTSLWKVLLWHYNIVYKFNK